MYHINITKINTNYLNHNYHRYPSVLTIAFSGNNIHDRHSLKLKAQTCCSHCSHHLYKRAVATPAKAQQVDSQWPLETRIKESNMCSFMFLSHSRQDWQNPSQHDKTTANTKMFFFVLNLRSSEIKPTQTLNCSFLPDAWSRWIYEKHLHRLTMTRRGNTRGAKHVPKREMDLAMP